MIGYACLCSRKKTSCYTLLNVVQMHNNSLNVSYLTTVEMHVFPICVLRKYTDEILVPAGSSGVSHTIH